MNSVHHPHRGGNPDRGPGPELRAFDAPGGGDDPDPVASAAVALTIRAPRGRLTPAIGWTLYAVREEPDGEGGLDVVAGQALSDKYPSVARARRLAEFHAEDRTAIEVEGATALVVNDQSGRQWLRIPLARAA